MGRAAGDPSLAAAAIRDQALGLGFDAVGNAQDSSLAPVALARIDAGAFAEELATRRAAESDDAVRAEWDAA
jgi:hypothetical protein